MKTIDRIRKSASEKEKTIVLPRSSDERVLRAAEYLTENEICEVILIKNEGSDIPLDSELVWIDPSKSEHFEQYVVAFFEKRKHKGLTIEEARNIISDPLFYAASMVAAGDADGCVAGSVSTTGDVLRAAIQTIGLKQGSNVVSSIFLMSFEDGRVFSYGDCAVVPYPDARQLASIAIDSANTHFALTSNDPKVAMLSFSTKGSARHERVELVQQALQLAQTKAPELNI
ncbi:MAG: phosphate acyltransferase, partial [Balneolaceae bacterium]